MLANDRPEAPDAPPPPTADRLRRLLAEQIAQRAGIPPAEVDPDRPLEEFGLASRDAVAVAGELERLLGRALPATLVWEYPTINRLAAALSADAPPGPYTPTPATPPDDSEAQASAVRHHGSDAQVPATRPDGSDAPLPTARPGGSDPQAPAARPGGSDAQASAARHHSSDAQAPAARPGGSGVPVPAALPVWGRTPKPSEWHGAHTPQDEPVAVVGIGLRLPGGERGDLTGAEAFWDFLRAGGDAVREVPEGRWEPFDDGSPEVADLLAGTTRLGGFLSGLSGFDARFFGITPREATLMDPQQRLVLEVAWAAFEHAGLAPARLRGTRTGVFVGVGAPEFAALTVTDPAGVEPFTTTGVALSIVANRLSYLLDLRGPSMVVDTACSSSLVATHLAVRALRAGDADVALAGGVNVLLSPTITMTFDQGGGTAADGRCKPFDARADGMVRAEGCGAVVLKRLADAVRDGDRVLVVIRGTGVNSDGRSNGLVAPNSAAQRELLHQVYATAGVDPREVDYLEAHGTGTFLGDPIEASAAGQVMGAGRTEPLLIGSVKSNLGHLESAAGIAGLIKTVLALHHRTIPPTLHYTEPNPHIPFEELGLRVVAEETHLPHRGRPARAGVSGFGFGGTNAHILLESAPDRRVPRPATGVVRSFPLSDVEPERVRDYAGTLAAWLPEDPDPAVAAALSLTLHRRDGRGRSRARVLARDTAGLRTALGALAMGDPHPAVVTGKAQGAPGAPVWVFSGYGAQRTGMAQRLLEEEAAFAETIDDLDPLVAEESGYSLWEMLERGERVPLAHSMEVLFAIQLGLARMWASYGVTPGAVVGHSMGEVAAAVVAGRLTMDDGVKVIARRTRLLLRLVGTGSMAVLGAPEPQVRDLSHDLPDVHPAVFASPRQTVVTGDADQIATLLARAEAAGLLARPVKAEAAGHSPQIDPLLPELRKALADVGTTPGTPIAKNIRFYTTALTDPRLDGALDADYWAQNLRNPVRLYGAITAAADDGFRTFVEINAHPLLTQPLDDTLTGTDSLIVHSLKRAPKGTETDDTLTFHTQLATLAVHGYQVTPPTGGTPIDVPLPSFRHEHLWPDTKPHRTPKNEHPLLGTHVELPGEDRHAWRTEIPDAAITRVHGLPILAPAALAEMALAAGTEALGHQDVHLNTLWIERPFPATPQTIVTTTFSEPDHRLEIHARTEANTWTHLATATVTPTPNPAKPPPPNPDARPASPPPNAPDHDRPTPPPSAGGDGRSAVSPPDGPDLRSVTAPSAGRGDRPASSAPNGPGYQPDALPVNGAVSEIPAARRGSRHYRLHPEVFDHCLAALYRAAGEGTWLAESMGDLRVHGPTHRGGQCRVAVEEDGDSILGSIHLTTPDGYLLAEATGVALRRVERPDIPVPLADKLVEPIWVQTPLQPPFSRTATHTITAPLAPAAPSASAGASASAVPSALEVPSVPAGPSASAGAFVSAGASASVALSRTEGGSWLVLGEVEGAFGAALVAELGARGEAVVYEAGGASVGGVVFVPPSELGDEDLVLRVAEVSRSVPGGARLWITTRSALPVLDGEGGNPRQGFVRALTRVLAFEQAGLKATLVDVDRPVDMVNEVLGGDSATEVAWRGGTRYVARLAHAGVDQDAGGVRRVVRRGGAYVITGGYGGIGLVAARVLAERGAGRVVLSGRSGPGAEAEKAIARLRDSGVDVAVVLGDIAAAGTAERLVAAATEGGLRLCGVIHGAAGLDDRLIGDLGADDLHRVWAPKAGGAWRLHEATRGVELDFFLLHSSAAALLGSPGQGSYAAANAALDALACWRRAQGLAATAVGWGTWAQVGGAADLAIKVLDPISPDEGARAMEALLAHDRTFAGVLRFDPVTAVELFPEIKRMPYFAALVEAVGPAADDGAGEWPGVAALRAMEPARARAAIARQVRFRIASVLGYVPERLDPGVPLTELGLDSLVAIRIKNNVEHDLGLTVPPALLLQGASIDAFQEWAADQLGIPAAAPPATAANAEEGYVMPRDAAERLAVRIFEEVLGLERVGVTADFFELGGQDHQADQVVAALMREVGGELSRGEVLATPTAEHVAAFVRTLDDEAARQVVRPLKPGGPGTAPLFLAHPAGGTTSCYRQLADLLGQDQPVYGLERLAEAPSVAERSARYAQLLLDTFPQGPFRLGGWSYGGVLAYETARQLGAAGHEVELVALLDAGLPVPVEDVSQTLARRFVAFADYLNETYGLNVELRPEDLAGLPEDAQFALVMERAAGLAELLPPAVLHHQLTSHQDTRSLEAYRPEPYAGRVVLYRAPEDTPFAVKDAHYVPDPTNRFGPLCANLDIVEVPGAHHLNVLDPPGVRFIAGHLAGLLAGRTPHPAT